MPFLLHKRIFRGWWDAALWPLNRKVLKQLYYCQFWNPNTLCQVVNSDLEVRIRGNDKFEKWLSDHKVPVGCFRRRVSEKHQGTLERQFSEILELHNLPFVLMLTYTCSWKCWTLYFTFTIWSGEPAFMNSSQLLPISDTFLWAITFWIFLIIDLSLLIPSWSSPPSFQVIIITVICVITTLCMEQNSDVH